MKHIIVAVTGSIAAYKACDLVSQLSKDKDLDVDVIMTQAACQFVQPLSFEALLHKKVYLDPFVSQDGMINHIYLAQKADLMIMVPASANSIAKISHGLACDLLSDTWLAATCPKIICPAMNVHMYENAATKRNLAAVQKDGVIVVEPTTGHLACGDTGKGKLADVSDILEAVYLSLTKPLLKGKRILISAGPTQEAIDPVRYITNHSTGKMGYALAKAAARFKAEVTLVSGPTQLKCPPTVRLIQVTSAKEMAEAILREAESHDYIIMSAAVADYRPEHTAQQKIKKSTAKMSLNLTKTTDILYTLGQNKKDGQLLCGFAMETENLLTNAKEKLEKKNCDLLVANSIAQAGAGFAVDTNIATLLSKDGEVNLPLMSKDDLAKQILLTLKELEEKK